MLSTSLNKTFPSFLPVIQKFVGELYFTCLLWFLLYWTAKETSVGYWVSVFLFFKCTNTWVESSEKVNILHTSSPEAGECFLIVPRSTYSIAGISWSVTSQYLVCHPSPLHGVNMAVDKVHWNHMCITFTSSSPDPYSAIRRRNTEPTFI